MRKFALVAAAALMAAAGSAVKADFVFQTVRTTISGGIFNGDDQVVLQVKNGTGTAQTGNIISTLMTLSSTATSPQFFIRTWDKANGSWDTGDVTTPGSNADFGNEGYTGSDFSTVRPGPVGSSIFFQLSGALGTTQTSSVLGATTPSETASTYTDGQAVSGFTANVGIGGTNGSNDAAFHTLAVAIVPSGQEVTFSGQVSSATGTSPNVQMSVSDPTVPEPASLAVFGLGFGLLARRRRTA